MVPQQLPEVQYQQLTFAAAQKRQILGCIAQSLHNMAAVKVPLSKA